MPIAQSPAEQKRLSTALLNLIRLYRDRFDPDPLKSYRARNQVGNVLSDIPYDLLTNEEEAALKAAIHNCENVGEPNPELGPGQWVTMELIAKRAPLLIAQCERLLNATRSKPRSASHRRRRRGATKPKPLTARQVEAAQLVGEYKGNVSAAAKAAGVDRKTLDQHYKAAMKKSGAIVVKHGTKRLASDQRGQALASDDRRKDL